MNRKSDRAAGLTDLPRLIRRPELKRIVPLSDTTIYELEQRGEFPRRFNRTPRCVVWDLREVEAWMDEGDRHLKLPRPRRRPRLTCAGRGRDR